MRRKKGTKEQVENIDQMLLTACVYVSVSGLSYVTAPLMVPLPVFLFLLLVRRGYDLSMSLHPGIQCQDVL